MDDDDITAFIERDYARVVRALAVVCGDRQRAEDAVQEAIVDVWTKQRDVHDMAAWVTTASLNRVRSRWRSAAAEERAYARFAARARSATTEPATVVELDDRLAGALRALPYQQRAAVALHYLLDLPVAAVATRLGIAEGTAKVHLHRGRERLRAELGFAAQEVEDHV